MIHAWSRKTTDIFLPQANRNRLLDVARETFKENVGDIYQLNTALSEKHGLPITLVYQESGFVFALKKDDLEGELPKGFLNVSAQKGRWTFSSLELVCKSLPCFEAYTLGIFQKKMNARMKDALDETLILSNTQVFVRSCTDVPNDTIRIIQELVAEILSHSGALYTASEAVGTTLLIVSMIFHSDRWPWSISFGRLPMSL